MFGYDFNCYSTALFGTFWGVERGGFLGEGMNELGVPDVQMGLAEDRL